MRENLISYLYEYAGKETDVAFNYRRKLRRSRWSYARLARTAFQFARELEARGLKKGDHLIIWDENCSEWVAAFYGSLLVGVVVVPIDEQGGPDFVERVCRQTRPRLLLRGSRPEAVDCGCEELQLSDLAGVVGGHSTEIFEARDIYRDDVVEVVFTSGTTADPKGVPLSHENILANVEAIEKVASRYIKWEFLVHPIRILCLLPFSHVFGQLMGIFIPPLLRAEVVLRNRHNPSDIIEAIRKERVSVLATVPRILETLERKIEREFESRGRLDEFRSKIARAERWNSAKKWWKFRRVHSMFGLKFWAFVSGGAVLSGEAEDFWMRLGFVVVQGYGMTETSALVSLNNPFKLRRGSLGEILSGQEVRIDESGEILVRGRNVSRAETAAENGGWLRTGDLGYRDETGRLYFKGRKKDVIVTSAGLNVYPEDIERELARQPEIVQSAVVGIEGPSGDEPAAALIPKPGTSAEEAVRRANEALAPFQQIRRWVVWPEPDFPRTSTMKVRKNAVADFIMRTLSADAGTENRKVSDLGDILKRISGEEPNRTDREARLIEDLKLDSLARVELMSAMEERYQIDLDEQAFTAAQTVADVERLIREERPTIEAKVRFHFPQWPLSAPVQWLRLAFYYLVILPVTLVLCRVSVRGIENLAAIDSPVLFASNHVTEIDAALIMSALPHRFRSRLAIAMDGEKLMSYRHPPAGTSVFTKMRLSFQYWLAVGLFNVFPLPRKSGFRRSFEFAGEAMDERYNILIFPEGELTKDGRTQRLRPGVALLADGLETATVPIKISGLYELKASGRRFFAPPRSVSISFGRPVCFGEGKSAASFVGELQSFLDS